MYDKEQLSSYCLEQSALNLPGAFQQNVDYIRWRVRIPFPLSLSRSIRRARKSVTGHSIFHIPRLVSPLDEASS